MNEISASYHVDQIVLKRTIKFVAFVDWLMYTDTCCDMIAMKREVAVRNSQVFRGANVNAGIPAKILTTSHCTNNHLRMQK